MLDKLFLSTPSARRATFTERDDRVAERFLSTPSARRATRAERGKSQKKEFLSTPSARRATGLRPRKRNRTADFYPRPPRGGRRKCLSTAFRESKISIHALREEGDRSNTSSRPTPEMISIHALREEGDGDNWTAYRMDQIFLSTPSARRATRTT